MLYICKKLVMSKKIKYDVMISIKVKKEQAEKLKKLADERDTSQGAIIRQWIEKEPETK